MSILVVPLRLLAAIFAGLALLCGVVCMACDTLADGLIRVRGADSTVLGVPSRKREV